MVNKKKMNWINEFQRLKRIIEVKNGLYCEHLPLVGNEYNINANGKKVCIKCCDHHKKFEGVCLLCCPHNTIERFRVGVSFCAKCFSETPQNFCSPVSNTIIRWRKREKLKKKQQEEKIKKKQNFQYKSELIAIAKSLNIKIRQRYNKEKIKSLIDSRQEL